MPDFVPMRVSPDGGLLLGVGAWDAKAGRLVLATLPVEGGYSRPIPDVPTTGTTSGRRPAAH